MVLGTTSAIKVAAVRRTLAWQFGAAAARSMRVEGVKFDSAVSEQPVGKVETAEGP